MAIDLLLAIFLHKFLNFASCCLAFTVAAISRLDGRGGTVLSRKAGARLGNLKAAFNFMEKKVLKFSLTIVSISDCRFSIERGSGYQDHTNARYSQEEKVFLDSRALFFFPIN